MSRHRVVGRRHHGRPRRFRAPDIYVLYACKVTLRLSLLRWLTCRGYTCGDGRVRSRLYAYILYREDGAGAVGRLCIYIIHMYERVL